LARKVYLRPGVGIGRYRHIYGGKRNYGSCREHHADGAGKIIRDCLAELEKIEWVMRTDEQGKKQTKKHDKTKKKSIYPRCISPIGQTNLNQIALKVHKEQIEKLKARI
jgi:ribosomal protein S19E (S16A)